MSVTYKRLEALTHAALGNIKFISAADAQTSYATTATLITNIKSGDYPKDFVRDAILNSMALVAKAICENEGNPDRQLFRDVVGPVASSGMVGTVLQPSLGPYGAFTDGTDGRALQPRALHSVLKMLSPATAGLYTSDEHAFFARSGQTIWFVCPNASIRYERFIFTKPANTVFDGSTASVFSDDYESVIVSGAIKDIAVHANPAVAGLHASYFAGEIVAIKSGTAYKPSIFPPSPEA